MIRAAAPTTVRVLLVVLFATTTFATSPAEATPNYILDNGVIQIGVDIWGSLGACCGTLSGPEKLDASAAGAGADLGTPPPTTLVGLRDMATNFESVTYGTPFEGWGIADLLSVQGGGATTSTVEVLVGPSQGGSGATAELGGPTNLLHVDHLVSGSGTVKESDGSQLVTVNDLAGSAGDAVPGEGLLAGISLLRVTQEFRPSKNPRAYEVEVTLENLSFSTVLPRFRRTVDWDIDPTPTNEYVSLRHGPSTAVVASVGNGFNSPNPLVSLNPIGDNTIVCAVNSDFFDCGPDDLGAAVDFEFPAMEPGQKFRFWLYYGAAPTEAMAIDILEDLGASGGTMGQSVTDGTPMSFFLGWKMPWSIIDNGVVQLGIGPYGELTVPGGTMSAGGGVPTVGPPSGTTRVGVRQMGMNWEGLASEFSTIEGWGLADYGVKIHGGVRSSLFPPAPAPPVLTALGLPAQVNGVDYLTPVSFDVFGDGTVPESSGDRARVVTLVGFPPFARVTHDFLPSQVPQLYLVKVRIERIPFPSELSFDPAVDGFPSTSLGSLEMVYRRFFDWNAENTAGDELITINWQKMANVIDTSAYGDQIAPPGDSPLFDSKICSSGIPIFDCGPGDLGAALDFNFPLLAEGENEYFRLFYGAGAGSESGMLSALAAVEAEAYVFAQTDDPVVKLGGESLGEGPAMTYAFAYRDVLFEDDFESADSSAWSSTVPTPP